MAEIKIFKCDKCGKEFRPSGGGTFCIHGDPYMDAAGSMDTDQYCTDLCIVCMASYINVVNRSYLGDKERFKLMQDFGVK